MGSNMTQRNSNFRISERRCAAAVAAIQALPEKNYAWVHPNYRLHHTLAAVLLCWRWDLVLDDEGNVNGILFKGEKLGEDELLFQTIAPFVADGSYIEMYGEDGELWRWLFQGGMLITQEATITWHVHGEFNPAETTALANLNGLLDAMGVSSFDEALKIAESIGRAQKVIEKFKEERDTSDAILKPWGL